jgi:hypothetical protein
MLGFKRFSNARRVLAGVDLVQMIVKGIPVLLTTRVTPSPNFDGSFRAAQALGVEFSDPIQ